MKYQLSYGLALCLALLTLFFHEQISRFFQTSDTEKKILGRVEKSAGRSWRQNPLDGTPIELKEKSPLYHLDHIQTSSASRIEIGLLSGAKILVLPETRLILERSFKTNSLTILHVLEGNIKELKRPEHGRLQVFTGGRLSEIRGTGVTDSKTSTAQAPTENSLDHEEIRRVIGAQKNLFSKCYTNYLRKNPKASGKIQLEFTVNPNGQVASAKIHNSTIKDETLENCIVQVMKGTAFRSFSGGAKKIIYPLSFGTY